MIDPQSIVHDISSEPLDNNIIISNRLNRDIFIRWLRGIRLKLLWDVKAHPLVVNSCLYYNLHLCSYTVYSFDKLFFFSFFDRAENDSVQYSGTMGGHVDCGFILEDSLHLLFIFMSNLSNANNSTK